MQRFTLHTLFDITETRQNRKQPDREYQWHQQQNFLMLMQTIGMRVNPQYDLSPVVEEVNLKNYHFGSDYRGVHKVWTWEFYIEYDSGFTDELGNPVGLLIEDLHFVPMITELDETAEFRIPMFDSQSTDYRNILVYAE
jgi:hypothetical protein